MSPIIDVSFPGANSGVLRLRNAIREAIALSARTLCTVRFEWSGVLVEANYGDNLEAIEASWNSLVLGGRPDVVATAADGARRLG